MNPALIISEAGIALLLCELEKIIQRGGEDISLIMDPIGGNNDELFVVGIISRVKTVGLQSQNSKGI